MKNHSPNYRLSAFFGLLFSCVLFFLFQLNVFAQQPVTVFTAQQDGDTIRVIIDHPNENKTNDVEVRLYEVIKVGDKTKTVLRSTSYPELKKTETTVEFTIKTPVPSVGFVNFDIDVSNYIFKDDKLNFRDSALPVIKAAIVEGANNQVKVKFDVPSTVSGGCQGARDWIISAFNSRAKTTLTVTRTNNKTITYNIIEGDTPKPQIPITGPNQFAICEITSTLTLDKNLPARETLKPVLLQFDPVFVDSDLTLAGNRAFARLRAGISGSITTSALNEAESRDSERQNVLEIGGGLTTVKKKEDVTDPNKDRDTKGFLDLRIATPTKYFNSKVDDTGLRSFWSRTTAQFDAMISEGKISNDNLSTNTMHLYTQFKYSYLTSRKRAADNSFRNANYSNFIFEGGVAADRDLRVLDYTGGIDFNFEPGFLNRTFGNPQTGKAPTILFNFSPAGFELGARQVRRDTFFGDSDTFLRRYKFGGKFELQLPPYAQITIENRSWIRGEVNERRFRNYFKTSLTLYPRNLSNSFSAGVFLSYERGTLPPFVTPTVSTLKIGFRVRNKTW